MTDGQDDPSTPCLSHLLIDGHVVDQQTARDVATYRKAERERLYALRGAVPRDRRAAMSATIARRLDALVGEPDGLTVAAYWPIRGELDLRGWMTAAHGRGARIALPVVVERDRPVAFHAWTPGCPMTRGIWNIPVPRLGDAVIPDMVVVPLLGVDDALYRLGNGGGYYDRTLVRLPESTRAIGVGHDFARMKTIFPMPWDVPMDIVILGDGTVLEGPRGIERSAS